MICHTGATTTDHAPKETVPMEFIDVLNARHSARAFTPDTIPEARLQRVLERAAAAPSWSNTQPY